MNEPKKPFPDPLRRQRIFSDPEQIFAFVPAGLKAALEDGIVVVDTNALLVPYTTGPASLEQIHRIYKNLTSANRLRVPGQVAREFAENRAEKIKALFQELTRKLTLDVDKSQYPLLQDIPAYLDLCEAETQILSDIRKYRKAVKDLRSVVAGWNWNDPVSQIYREFFKASVVVDLKVEDEVLLKDLKYRQENKIPPGYKDANSEHSGVGDLLIWKTILHIGENESRNLIFVSGEEKPDWRYNSAKTSLYPRFELLEEYRVASHGKSFIMIRFAELLEHFGAPPEVVDEVRKEEAMTSLPANSNIADSSWGSSFLAEADGAVYRWLQEMHPNDRVERSESGVPDFLVFSANRLEGYEVFYFDYVDTSILDRFQRTLTQLAKIPVAAAVVLVSRKTAQHDFTDFYQWATIGLSEQEQAALANVGIIAGTIDETRRFVVLATMRPPGGIRFSSIG